MDLLFSFGFLQNVIFPTRVSDNSATLIDHVNTNSHFSTRKSSILVMDLSDHYPIFFHRDNTSHKKNLLIGMLGIFQGTGLLTSVML